MPNPNFQPSQIKNKMKREEESRKRKRGKSKIKLEKRLERAKQESKDPALKKKRLEENVPRTLDNTREFDPSTVLTADPSSSSPAKIEETNQDFSADPFAAYFDDSASSAPSTGEQKILITTSPKASKPSYEFCDELVGVFPGAEFIRRKKGKGFELGRIAGWAGKRGYNHLLVVNEDHKKPNAITLVYLPNGPTAYFKLTSVALTRQIYGHARATPHYPELVLNNFVTRLGHAVGRMFQTLFPPVPEFQGRQVVTLHNQRDFLFFRRHRYAFRSPEKVALQEIGPRFTLKLRWLKKGIPAVKDFGASPAGLQFDTAKEEDVSDDDNDDDDEKEPKLDDGDEAERTEKPALKEVVPPKEDEYLWAWKPELEPTRRTFHL